MTTIDDGIVCNNDLEFAVAKTVLESCDVGWIVLCRYHIRYDAHKVNKFPYIRFRLDMAIIDALGDRLEMKGGKVNLSYEDDRLRDRVAEEVAFALEDISSECPVRDGNEPAVFFDLDEYRICCNTNICDLEDSRQDIVDELKFHAQQVITFDKFAYEMILLALEECNDNIIREVKKIKWFADNAENIKRTITQCIGVAIDGSEEE